MLTDISEFADRYPNAEVIGTDLSPCQPQWIPPNARFEIDDATLEWTWDPSSFDFIHIRYVFGAIKDWTALFREAYRCCTPGGWVQSVECDVEFRSDDGTLELEPVMKIYGKLFREGGKVLDRPFFVRELQQQGMGEAGFKDMKTIDYKVGISTFRKSNTQSNATPLRSLLVAGPKTKGCLKLVILFEPHWRTTSRVSQSIFSHASKLLLF